MEGVMASALTGAMRSLLPKLAALLEKRYKLSRGAKKEIAYLREEMSSMNALLLKLARTQPDEQQRDWRDKVRELSYDMEDCVDIFTDELDSGGGEGLLSGLKKLQARYRIASRIQELKARAVETSDRHDRYSGKLGETVAGCPSRGLVAVDPRVQALYAEANGLVGMDGPKKKLVELLGSEEDVQQLRVIAVVGSGGMGKTTLASKVYAAMKSQFDCRAFVSVSQNPSMVKVLSDIYSGICVEVPSALNDECRLIDELREHLQDKRYLIVIDDLWTMKAWNVIKCLFVENNCGSRVITTTRIEDVAQACRSSFHGYVYKIKPLNDVDSRILFNRRIFYTEDACPDQLKGVSNEILRKCGGVPLAILSVASILASHEEVNSKEIWEKIKNNLGLQLEGNPSLEWMRHVLNLGYNDLPADIKTCMLYLGIFPEDSEISKDDLVKRWIAEGIVTELHGHDPEEIAESYFNKLINRNMIQVADFDDCGHIQSCRVHDLMLEFIIMKSTEENFLTVINDLYRRRGCLPVRRLSLQVENSECNLQLGNMVLTQVRSLNFWGPVQCMPSLSKFQLLRVLHIDACNSKVKRDGDLSSACIFFQLRYLRIRGIDCEKMLKQLRKSQHLQTLDIVDSETKHYFRLDVRELPLTLQHLIVPETVQLIGQIGRLRALRTLGTLELVNDVENIEGLGELANLRELKLYCPSGVRENTADSLLSCMSKLGVRNLRSLTIIGGSSDEDVLTHWSPPPRHLRRLHLVDFHFSIVPDWIVQLHMLRSLEVRVVSLSRHGVEVLTGLTSLVHLRLIIENDAPEEGLIVSSAAFMNLKEFSFRYSVPCLTFEAGAMPRLARLLIECGDPGSQQDDGILNGIENLGSLEVFKVEIYMYGFNNIVSVSYCLPPPEEEEVVQRRQTLEAALRKAISKHPGSPVIYIQSIGSIAQTYPVEEMVYAI
uniref:Uncharacterized protein n=1 Tax=Avena sativa TaxID=4498 RepID=A0ACD5XLN9_AVESA